MRGQKTLNRSLLVAGALPLLAGAASAQLQLQPRSGEPVRGLTDAELADFEAGKLEFNTPRTEATGLGPIFNDISCGNCHSTPAIGGSSVRTVTRFGKAAVGGNPFDPLENLGGSLLQEQAFSASCEEVVPPEADVVAQRLTPTTFGAGLLSLIDDGDIDMNVAMQPSGINGFANPVPLLEDANALPRYAKFGWKGVIATAHSFSFDASAGEMSFTTVVIPGNQAPNGDQAALMMCDNGPGSPEDMPDMDGKTDVDRYTDFMNMLAPPPQTPKSGMSGELLFETIGCADCHVNKEYITGPSPIAALSGVSIKPYSNLLLHDMGALGDQIVQGPATEQIMHTRPLWGLQNRQSYLHDGRATGGTFGDNMRDAIDDHGGEGQASGDNFFNLPIVDQELVIDFLGSLGRAEFDWERDNDVDEFDYFFIQPFITDPVPSFTPDDEGALCDIDQDGDFDLRDFGMLQRGFSGNL